MGWAVWCEDILDCSRMGLRLEEAFHVVLAELGYTPEWETVQDGVRLRFRYEDGGLVGDTEPGRAPIEFEASARHGVFVARDHLMQKTITAGIRGWRALPMDRFWIAHSVAGGACRREEEVSWTGR